MPRRTYPRIDGPKRQSDGTYVVLVYRSADDLERVPAENLEKAQKIIATLQQAKNLFEPVEEKSYRSRGRKPKLTPEVHKSIVNKILEGTPYETAAVSSGICEATLYVWLRKGREATDEDSIYFKFLEDVEVATAEAERAAAKTIYRARETDWRAAECWLKRNPKTRSRWSDRDLEVKVSGELETKVSMDDTAKSAAEKLASLLAAGTGTGEGGEDPGDPESG